MQIRTWDFCTKNSNFLVTLNISNFFVFKYFLNRKKVLKSWESNSFIYRGNVVVSVHLRTKKYIPSWINFTKIQISHLHHRIRFIFTNFLDNRGSSVVFMAQGCKNIRNGHYESRPWWQKRFEAKILSELEVTTRRSLMSESALLFCPLKINIAI